MTKRSSEPETSPATGTPSCRYLMSYLGAEPARYQLRTLNFSVNIKLTFGAHSVRFRSASRRRDFYLFPTQRVEVLNHLWLNMF